MKEREGGREGERKEKREREEGRKGGRKEERKERGRKKLILFNSVFLSCLPQIKGQQTFSVKGQIVNIFGFAGQEAKSRVLCKF